MAVSKTVKVTGGVVVDPPSSCGFPSIQSVGKLNSEQTVQSSSQTARTLNSAVTFVDLLTGTGLSVVSLVHLRVHGGSLEVRVSSAFGNDQIFPVSKQFLFDSPSAGAGLTAVAIRGVADFEVVLAGT